MSAEASLTVDAMKRPVAHAALVITLVLGATGCASTRPVEAVPVGTVASALPTLPRIPLPAHPRAYFFGDSWTAGKSASVGNGYARVAGRALGWTVTVAPNGSGTGFVHTYAAGRPLYPARAATLAPIKADIIILQGGLNDRPVALTGFAAAVRKTVKTLLQKSGGAHLVMLGPASFTGVATPALTTIDAQERSVAQQLGIRYISPLKQKWINPANVSAVIDPATQHPSTSGHAYFGGRVAQALASMTVTVATSPPTAPSTTRTTAPAPSTTRTTAPATSAAPVVK
jgi:lysophospholipase L1-like esterase